MIRRSFRSVANKLLSEPVKTFVYRLFRPFELRFFANYQEWNLITDANTSAIANPLFAFYYEVACAKGLLTTPHRRWRLYNAWWCGLHASQLKGDFIECGVDVGLTSYVVMNALNFNSITNKTFLLIDSFEGVKEAYLNDREKARRKRIHSVYQGTYEKAVELFSEFHNAKVVKGYIPDILYKANPPSGKIAYLHIDLNCAIPEVAAVEYYWDMLVTGGVVLLDDYCEMGFEEQHKAFDEFAKAKGIKVLSMPTGQGLMIKV